MITIMARITRKLNSFNSARLSAGQVVEACGINYATLDSWARTEFYRPVREASGSGSTRAYTPADAITIRIILAMREQGASKERIKVCLPHIKQYMESKEATYSDSLSKWLYASEDGICIDAMEPIAAKLVEIDAKIVAGDTNSLSSHPVFTLVSIGMCVRHVGKFWPSLGNHSAD
jgi:DNA-binding transcriptional MerR regulator